MLGLYVHVPFCSAICNYCNFNRGVFEAELKARYVEGLIAEIRRAGHGGSGSGAVDTIFFGGGTPSLLEPDEIARIIAACGLAWHDSCLRPESNPRAVKTPSKWQTRQPIYGTSVERWRRYEPWLGPLRALVDDGSETDSA